MSETEADVDKMGVLRKVVPSPLTGSSFLTHPNHRAVSYYGSKGRSCLYDCIDSPQKVLVDHIGLGLMAVNTYITSSSSHSSSTRVDIPDPVVISHSVAMPFIQTFDGDCLPEHELVLQVVIYNSSNPEDNSIRAVYSAQKKFMLLSGDDERLVTSYEGPSFSSNAETKKGVDVTNVLFVPGCEIVLPRGQRINRLCSFTAAYSEMCATASAEYPGYSKAAILRWMGTCIFVGEKTLPGNVIVPPLDGMKVKKLEALHEVATLSGIRINHIEVTSDRQKADSPRSLVEQSRVFVVFKRFETCNTDTHPTQTLRVEPITVRNCAEGGDMCAVLVDNETVLALDFKAVVQALSIHTEYTQGQSGCVTVHMHAMDRGESRTLHYAIYGNGHDACASTLSEQLLSALKMFNDEKAFAGYEYAFNMLK